MLLAADSAFLFAFVHQHHHGVAVFAACLYQATSVSGWNSLDALSTESFPTNVRTTGMGLLSATGRFASIVAMVVNADLQKHIVQLFVVTGSFTVVGAIASFFLPYDSTGE